MWYNKIPYKEVIFLLEGFIKLPISSGNAFLSVTNNGLNFNGTVVSRMKKAKKIILLLNVAKHQIAIQEVNEKDEETNAGILFFKDETDLTSGIRLNNREIQQRIAIMMNWNLEEYNYRADGFYVEDEHAMIFDLNSARRFKKRVRKETKN
mgnify:CR=1 FL=1